jgi:CMP-N,N'-diacetyllegionaminic acid synthase
MPRVYPDGVMTKEKPTAVALIPARSGSSRIADKNIRQLRGHPLLAYSICSARQSGIFDAVVLATDSERYAEIGRHYGAEVPFIRPAAISTATSPDIDWVELTLARLAEAGHQFDAFSILRPTSPFRKPATILRAWTQFVSEQPAVDSLRAVEKCTQHPGKMWVVNEGRMTPLLSQNPSTQPYHSSQYAALPIVYVQNASLEIAWTRTVQQTRSIAGHNIAPFFTEGDEGIDINTPEDWWYAEHVLESGAATLPAVDREPFDSSQIGKG